MVAIKDLWRRLLARFVPPSPEVDEARRRAIHVVTQEQLGVSHWSSHFHY